MKLSNTLALLTVCACSLHAQFAPLPQPNQSQGSASASPAPSWRQTKPKASSSTALSRFTNADTIIVGKNGTPQFVRGNLGLSSNLGSTISAATLSAIAPIFGFSATDLTVTSTDKDSLGFHHIHYSATYLGREIVGAELILHVNKSGVIYCANGSVPDESVALPQVAAISASTAHAANHHIGAETSIVSDRLVYFLDSLHHMHLAWETKWSQPSQPGLTLKDYVDAASGSFIEELTPIRYLDSRSIYDVNGSVSYYQDDTASPPTGTYYGLSLSRSEGGSTTGIKGVDDAYNNLGTTFAYYYNTFGQTGMRPSSGTNVLVAPNSLFEYNEPGYPAVYYTGENSFYVNVASSDRIYLGTDTAASYSSTTTTNASTAMASALDVVGHEYTHGVSAYRSVGALGYSAGENAALNEGISDIFGTMVKMYDQSYSEDSHTWIMGWTLSSPVRDLADPQNFGSSYADYYPTMNTSADAHYNCTIAGLAYQLLVDGGTHPRPSGKPNISVISVGYDHAQKIAYRAYTLYLSTGSGFEDFKAAMATAANDLYGSDAESEVDFAFDAVGVPYSSYSAHAINISTLGYVGSSGMTVGFTLAGSGSKNFLVRGVGPALSSFGVSGYLSDPTMTLYSGTTAIASNDNWSSASNASSIASTSSSVGAFSLPNPSLDSAILTSLSSGGYSAAITGVSGATGTALAEVYDSDTSSSGSDPHLSNISTLSTVSSSQTFTSGFVVTGSANKEVLIRADGPALSGFGVSSPCSNPTLTLFWTDSGGISHQIYSNIGWGNAWNASDISSAASTVGAFSLSSGSADCALLVSLPPGTYSAIVGATSGSSGQALLEVYDVR